MLLNYYGLPTAFSKYFKSVIISVILKAAKTECCDMGSKTQFYLAPCWLAVVSSFLEAFRENAHVVLG